MEIKNKIYLGDSNILIKEVPDRSVDLVVTDPWTPPYEFGTGGIGTGLFKYRTGLNQTYQEIHNNDLGKGIDLSILDELCRVMKKINIYIWCNKEQIYNYLNYFVQQRNCNFEFIIWGKTNPPPFLSGHYLKDKEYCLYFWEKGVKLHPSYETGRTVYTSSLNVSDKSDYGHPTIKPVPILENLIKNSSEPGDLILDVFLGSGSTAVAAKHTKRNYLGFEINPKYFQIASDRLNGINQRGELDLFETDNTDNNTEQLKLF